MTQRDTSPIGLEELSAYVDGELAAGRRAAVERHLADDADAARRVSAYRRQDDLLRQAMAPQADEGTPPQIAALLDGAAEGHGAGWRWMAAAAAVLLVAALAGGWWSRRRSRRERAMAGLASDAVAAHVAYAAADAPDPAQRAALAASLHEAVGAGGDLPDLSGLGYALAGGRPLTADTGPAVALWYRDGAGDVVTCYFVRETGVDASPYVEGAGPSYAVADRGGINVVYRLDEGYGYAVAGDLPPATLIRIASLGSMEVDQ